MGLLFLFVWFFFWSCACKQEGARPCWPCENEYMHWGTSSSKHGTKRVFSFHVSGCKQTKLKPGDGRPDLNPSQSKMWPKNGWFDGEQAGCLGSLTRYHCWFHMGSSNSLSTGQSLQSLRAARLLRLFSYCCSAHSTCTHKQGHPQRSFFIDGESPPTHTHTGRVTYPIILRQLSGDVLAAASHPARMIAVSEQEVVFQGPDLEIRERKLFPGNLDAIWWHFCFFLLQFAVHRD